MDFCHVEVEVLVPVMTRPSGTVCFAVCSNILHAASPLEFFWLHFFPLYWKSFSNECQPAAKTKHIFRTKCKIHELFWIWSVRENWLSDMTISGSVLIIAYDIL